ncbi:Cache 3/Cache 2 fusion domain-containing protein, partial [Stappia sp.]|uniref:methyl-accepting chemotaxis protein n=1 Tax=Stappia sp. TaxID=1870903 RepID=UPI003A9A2329
MRILSRLNLVSIVSLASAAILTLALATMGTVVYLVLKDRTQSEAVSRQNSSLRVAATIVERDMPGTRIDWTKDGNVARVEMNAIPDEVSDHTMIDTIGRMTGETVTVFKWDDETRDFWRKTTNIIKPDGTRAVGTKLGQTGAVYPLVTKGETFRGEAVILGKPYFTIYAPIFSPEGKIIGILYAGVSKAAITAVISNMTRTLALAFLPILAIAVFAMAYLARRLLRPIPQLADVTHRIADNDLSVEVPYTERTDEIGQLAGSVAVLRENALERNTLASQRDMTDEETRQRQIAVDALIAEFRETARNMVGAVSETATGLDATARQLSDMARESADSASETTNASSQATDSVQTVASAAEELSASIAEISRQVGQTTQVVSQATQGTHSTNEKVAG